MHTKIEKDSVSAQMTTGHEWDGLKELNTPLPKWWLYTFYACIAFSLVWVVLYPALPITGATGLQGLPGSDGSQGPQGIPGSDGPQGVPGPALIRIAPRGDLSMGQFVSGPQP